MLIVEAHVIIKSESNTVLLIQTSLGKATMLTVWYC